MTEFWVCEACKSLVRGNADTCYKCRAPRPAHVRELGIGARGAVLTPGIDGDLQQVGFLLGEGHRVLPTRSLAILTIVGTLLVLAATLVGTALIAYLGYAIPAQRFELLLDRDFLRFASTVDLVRSIAFLVSLGLWLAFETVSMHNAPFLGAGTPSSSIVAAVLWWFVPILNFVIPARIVVDLHARLASKGSSGQLVVGAWWTCFVASSLLVPAVLALASVSLVGMGIVGVSAAPTFAGATIGTVAIEMIGQGLYLAAGIAFIKVVIDLDSRQARRRGWLADGRRQFAAAAAAAAAVEA